VGGVASFRERRASLGVVRVTFVLIAAFLLPLEAAAWDLEASREATRYFGMLKLGVASAGTALLPWGPVLRRMRRPASERRLREALLIALGALAALCRCNCFQFPMLLAYAFLWRRSEAIGVGICALSAASWLIAGSFSARDEIFTWVSLANVLLVLFATPLAWQAASATGQTRRASRAAPR
jgi:hypothetical protein